MLVQLVRGGDCSDGKTCPALYRTDRDTLVVQGWVLTDSDLLSELDLPADMQAVEVPTGLLAEVIDSWPTSHQTGRGTLLVPGTTVTDLDALQQLRLAPNEQVVEVPTSLLSEVLQAC
jgi:hypothetical protein